MIWSDNLIASLRPERDLASAKPWLKQIEALVEILPDPVLVVARDGVIVAVNAIFARRMGTTAARLVGGSHTDLHAPPTARALTYLRRCAGSRQRLPGALAFRTTDGADFSCRCDGAALPALDPAAPPLVLLHCRPRQETAAPFTRLNEQLARLKRENLARRAAEEALRERERRFRELLGALPAAVYTTDAQGRITYYNEAAVALAGRTPKLGSDEWCVTWRLYWPDGTPMRHDQCPMAVALKENRPIRGEEAIAERPDGTRVPFIPFPTPLRDASGALVGAVNMLVDITERKAAERTRAHLAAMVESSDDVIISKDLEGIITSWNRGAEATFGYRAEEVIGRPIALLFPPDRLNEEDVILDRIRRGERIDHFETVRRRKDGREIDVSVTISPIRDANGRIIGASKIARDISDRKRVEATLRELNETLERRVEERTRALEAEMREREKAEAALHLAQRLEAIGQLTGGVAHDFNNLLTVVAGNLDLMRHLTSTSGEISKETLRRLIEGTQRAASRGERLTRQLLAFSRQGSIQPQVVDLHETIAGFAAFLQRVVGETVELHLDFDEERRHCKLDPAQFEAAVLNLAVNARDAMPKGGRLTIETSRIAIGAEEARTNPVLGEGSYLVVSVSDTGTGMPLEVMDKVFEPFFTTKEVGKGSGLGLAQVWGFAKQSGGHAAIESEPDKGTTVRLYLPECLEAAEAETDERERSEQCGSETILVVEDDEFVREVTVEALGSLGYATVVARDGREALDVLNRGEPVDLLFTDYVMPGGLSGAELAREARRLRPDLKVLLTSGYARHAGTDGAAHNFPIIAKPYRRLELAETVRAILADETRHAS
jgi:PAS domain S-box-containing protein